jgi:hypothetical protein
VKRKTLTQDVSGPFQVDAELTFADPKKCDVVVTWDSVEYLKPPTVPRADYVGDDWTFSSSVLGGPAHVVDVKLAHGKGTVIGHVFPKATLGFKGGFVAMGGAAILARATEDDTVDDIGFNGGALAEKCPSGPHPFTIDVEVQEIPNPIGVDVAQLRFKYHVLFDP